MILLNTFNVFTWKRAYNLRHWSKMSQRTYAKRFIKPNLCPRWQLWNCQLWKIWNCHVNLPCAHFEERVVDVPKNSTIDRMNNFVWSEVVNYLLAYHTPCPDLVRTQDTSRGHRKTQEDTGKWGWKFWGGIPSRGETGSSFIGRLRGSCLSAWWGLN